MQLSSNFIQQAKKDQCRSILHIVSLQVLSKEKCIGGGSKQNKFLGFSASKASLPEFKEQNLATLLSLFLPYSLF